MLKLSHYDEIPIGDRLWLSDHNMMLQHDNRQLMIMCSVLISYCFCRRPSWKPKTQPNGSSVVVWLRFSTRFTRKTLDYSNGSCLYSRKYSKSRNIILKGVPSDRENRVRRRLVEFLVINSVYLKKSVPADTEKVVHGILRQMQLF